MKQNGGEAMGPVVLLWFDVEDYINKESDDALHALLKMMAAKGVRGTFKLVGEKIRVLEERGRQDILEALKQQGIGYHTDLHSQHPTVSEYCEPLGFSDGAALFEQREVRGLEDLRRILPVPVATFGQPGSSWAAQAFPVLRKWGIPTYVDQIDTIDLNRTPFWFCGMLTVTFISGSMRMNLDPKGLEPAIRQFDQLVEQGEQLISIYYHPCEFATVEFWDALNYGRGINTPRKDWKASRLRAPGEMEHDIEKLGCLIDHMLKRHSHFISADELLGSPGFGHAELNLTVTDADIRKLADAWRVSIGYSSCQGNWLCAAEVFSLLRAACCDKPLHPSFAYGPEQRIASEEGAAGFPEDYRKALCTAWPQMMGVPQIPDCFMLNGKRVNPVDMACTAAWLLREQPEEDTLVPIVRGFLEPERKVSVKNDFGSKWIIFPEHWQAEHILEITRLQTWTLKPARWIDA